VKVPKPTDDDVAYFRSLVRAEPGVELKPMFGNLGAFVNGNMFAGLFGSEVGVKLAPADQEALIALGGGPFGPAERPMGGYVSLPEAVRKSDEAGAEWVGRALAHVAALPPKKPKARR
jgi:TfoX/Sxy family transcriptional regulator of competence genes